RLARLELAGRDLDEHPGVRVAELALEHDLAVLGQRDDRDRAGVADVFAGALPAIRQRHRVAMHLEERAVVHHLAGEPAFGEGSHFCGYRVTTAAKQSAMSGSGITPRARSSRPLAEISTRMPGTPTAPLCTGESPGSSKYM